jgi:hypothetical protein
MVKLRNESKLGGAMTSLTRHQLNLAERIFAVLDDDEVEAAVAEVEHDRLIMDRDAGGKVTLSKKYITEMEDD